MIFHHRISVFIFCFIISPLTLAQDLSIEDRFAAMEKRMQALETMLHKQNDVIKAKDEKIMALENKIEDSSSSSTGGWFQKVELSGVVEVEANSVSADGEDDTSDIIVPTVELGVNVQVNDWVSAEIIALYEEETNNGGDLNIDTAMISLSDPDNIWFVNAGQFVVPFGTFATNMVSDPLTLDFGETADSSIEIGLGNDTFSGSVYVFQGDKRDKINNFGLALNATIENEDFNLSGHIGYLNDLRETDGIGELGGINSTDKSAGWVASAELNAGAFSLIGEYLTASDSFSDAGNQKPKLFNIEGAYSFSLLDKPTIFAVGYQGTDDMSHASWGGVTEQRLISTLSVEVLEGTTLLFEYKNDEDYDGADTNTATGKLAVEF